MIILIVVMNKKKKKVVVIERGLEPRIFGLGDRRLIH